ncbi:GFA family protein [Mesorhizobium sp. Z1-4]|uniref:GFA family protein n=1 Tax=Mesorhizobium sp. Z1-4 TaxID=2448478 RepID=UPI000FDA3571|nr:GFA family protein [Mesorhizobium sp. Z1-4]
MSVTGGCQCGAVRYRAESLGRASICHCRMCQKAFGSFFGPLVAARGLVWTRGEPARFASSNKVERGFCAGCGTPLTYDYGGDAVEVAIGTLDEPGRAAPVIQLNPADKLPFYDTLHALPWREANPSSEAFLSSVASNQHPDHDTNRWPPEALK